MDVSSRTIEDLLAFKSGEIDASRLARITYVTMGVSRTIEGAADLAGIKRGAARGWSKTYDWSASALVFDTDALRDGLKTAKARMIKWLDDFDRKLQRAMDKQVDSLNKSTEAVKGRELDFSKERKADADITSKLVIASRTIANRPTQIMDLRVGPIDAVEMADEQLEAIARGGVDAESALMQMSQENAGKSVGVTTEDVSVTADDDAGVTEKTEESKEPMGVE